MASELFDQLARFGDRLEQEAAAIGLEEVTSRRTPAQGESTDQPHNTLSPESLNSTEVELEMDTPNRFRYRYGLAIAVVGVAAAVVSVALVNSGDKSKTATAASTSSTALTATSTSSTAAPTDKEIADAALLTYRSIGDGYYDTPGQVFVLDATVAARIPSCSSYLDSVFEITRRSATVSTRTFSKSGAAFGQYVAVFPTEDEAVAMMTAVKDPGFPACMAAYSTAQVVTQSCCEQASYRAVDPLVLAPVGDDLAVVSLEGSLTDRMTKIQHEDKGPFTFMRVGRAVVSFNPSFSPTWAGDPGYPKSQPQQILAVTVGRLALIQGK